MNKNRGQNTIEFIIILSLVVVVGILTVTVLGGNVKTMFEMTNDKAKEYKPFDFGGAPSATNTSVGSDVIFNDDGSASFSVGGQDLTISSETLTNFNDVFQTSGARGLTPEVMAAMQKLIADNQGDYAGDVPIEMAFGDSVRREKDDAFTFVVSSGIESCKDSPKKSRKLILSEICSSASGSDKSYHCWRIRILNIIITSYLACPTLDSLKMLSKLGLNNSKSIYFSISNKILVFLMTTLSLNILSKIVCCPCFL